MIKTNIGLVTREKVIEADILLLAAEFKDQPDYVRERAKAIFLSILVRSGEETPLNAHLLPKNIEEANKRIIDAKFPELGVYKDNEGFFDAAQGFKSKVSDNGLGYILGFVYGGLKQGGDAREDSETFKEFKPEIAISIYWERKNAGLYIKDLEMMWKIVSHIFLNEKSQSKLKRQLETEVRDGLHVAVPFIYSLFMYVTIPWITHKDAIKDTL